MTWTRCGRTYPYTAIQDSVLATDPRRESGYRKQVLEGLGIGEAKDLERWSWLSPADVEVLAEMIERKAAA